MEMADQRLRPIGKSVFWMLGNDDHPALVEPLQNAAWGEHAEGRVLSIDNDHAILSWGWSNPTPWNSFREMTEDELTAHFDELFGQAPDTHRIVFNAHVPPFDTGLDDAPVLDAGARLDSDTTPEYEHMTSAAR